MNRAAESPAQLPRSPENRALLASLTGLGTKAPPFLWLLAPLAFYFTFGWIGFVATDDGWLQAVARRIGQGELPHRDFISVRPTLSAILQVPLVWWGGDYTIMLSRLWGWMVLAATCWWWSGRTADREPWPARYALYAGALILCAHSFQVMAWHTFDAMLLATAAAALARRGDPAAHRLAFACVGLAALCRQNFALFAPVLAFATYRFHFRGWLRAALWTALPVALYIAVIAAAGGGAGVLAQIFAMRGELDETAVGTFLTSPWFIGGMIAGLATTWAFSLEEAHRGSRPWPPLLFGIVSIFMATSLWMYPMQFHYASLALLGFLLGRIGPLWTRIDSEVRPTLVTAAGLGWVVAVSVGYRSPAFAAGLIWLAVWRTLQPAGHRAVLWPPLLVALPALAIAFIHARTEFPYRDRGLPDLRYELGEVLPGAAGVRTNLLVYGTFADLAVLTHELESKQLTYAVLTDCAAFWIRNPQRNPLPCEWPQATELGFSPELFRDVIDALSRQPPTARIVVQKFLTGNYGWEMARVPTDSLDYSVQNWVRTHCEKVQETAFFEVYLPPVASP